MRGREDAEGAIVEPFGKGSTPPKPLNAFGLCVLHLVYRITLLFFSKVENLRTAASPPKVFFYFSKGN